VRLGFRRVLMPDGGDASALPAGAHCVPISDLDAAVRWLRASSTVHGAANNS
jgi:hypothetical protein